MTKPVEISDLEHIARHTSHLWDEIKGQNIFITGGTGFFGCWLLESFAYACDNLGLNSKAFVLSRDPAAFTRKSPRLAAHPAVNLIEGDVRSFKFPAGKFPLVIHAATDTGGKLNQEDPKLMFETIVEGTRQTLEFASTHGTEKFLLLSSGAVYGKPSPDITNIKEDYTGGPDPADPFSAYSEGKRATEVLSAIYSRNSSMEVKVARCFAFVGPHLPLDSNYAIGNFIRSAMQNSAIHISGDGTPLRSYLYAADLVIWLWTVLVKGLKGRPYNVGSDREISIRDLAYLVRGITNPGIEIVIAQKADPARMPQRYIPSTQRARDELKLDSWIPLEQAIKKTYQWNVT